MRKHDVRKWLHAILDLLPVILIPVFMIYSHRHQINDGSIQVQEKIAINFNQINEIPTRQVNSSSIIYSGLGSNNLEIKQNDIILVKYYQNFVLDSNVRNTLGLIGNDNSYIWFDQTTNRNLNQGWYYERKQAIKDCRMLCYWLQSAVPTIESSLDDIQVFNLTTMFGSGNEPSVAEFNELFPQSYYQYTLSHKMLIDGDLVTYNDTDIMSQFTYQLYNSVDKYFNMGNVFHLNEVYDWFNLNIFNGQAPIYIFIVYQIVLYELIMDLLMLLYALFMWFIDMIEKLMEKPLNSVK